MFRVGDHVTVFDGSWNMGFNQTTQKLEHVNGLGVNHHVYRILALDGRYPTECYTKDNINDTMLLDTHTNTIVFTQARFISPIVVKNQIPQAYLNLELWVREFIHISGHEKIARILQECDKYHENH